MERLDRAAAKAVASLIDAQPMSDGKLALAWRVAAGAALARQVQVCWCPDGTIEARVLHSEWLQVVRRARPMLLERLRHLLGPDAARRLKIDGD